MSRKLSNKEIKAEMLSVLVEIDRVCKLLNIKYFLFAGTLLGAVRHKGFIPWDDDVDIALLREDYEILLKEFNNYSKPEFRLISPYSDENYLWGYIKVINLKTTLHERSLVPPFRYGLFVDVFPLDYVDIKTAEDKQKLQDELILFNRRQMITDFRYAPLIWKIGNIWNLIIYKGKNRFSYLFRKAALNNIDFDNFQKKLSGGKVTDTLLAAFGPEPEVDKLLYKTKWYSSVIELEFEGYKFMAPAAYHEILSNVYGDYMTPPPKNKQKGEHLRNVRWY